MKSRQIARSLLLIAFIAVFFGSMGCSKSNDNMNSTPPVTGGTPGANEVWLQNSQFNPAILTVAVNTTVKWINKDGYDHTVTSDSPLFDSGILGSNAAFSYKFTAKGSYAYHCSIHTIMKGTIVVQ